jgi:hypothetical protein
VSWQQRGRRLIKERLEGVVVVPVDQGHIDTDVRQLLGFSQPTKPGSDDRDVWRLTRDLPFLSSNTSHSPSLTPGPFLLNPEKLKRRCRLSQWQNENPRRSTLRFFPCFAVSVQYTYQIDKLRKQLNRRAYPFCMTRLMSALLPPEEGTPPGISAYSLAFTSPNKLNCTESTDIAAHDYIDRSIVMCLCSFNERGRHFRIDLRLRS